MEPDRRQKRRIEIIEAAHEVLAEQGYSAMSMLAVAKHAKASNETLYNWFGSKAGLAQAMVEHNAERASAMLSGHLSAMDGGADPAIGLTEFLKGLGPTLLAIVTDERAVLLNRAAAAEAATDPALGRTIASHGRDRVMALLERAIAKSPEGRTKTPAQVREAADVFIRVLIGDLQVRRVIGVVKKPGPKVCRERTALACRVVMQTLTG